MHQRKTYKNYNKIILAIQKYIKKLKFTTLVYIQTIQVGILCNYNNKACFQIYIHTGPFNSIFSFYLGLISIDLIYYC